MTRPCAIRGCPRSVALTYVLCRRHNDVARATGDKRWYTWAPGEVWAQAGKMSADYAKLLDGLCQANGWEWSAGAWTVLNLPKGKVIYPSHHEPPPEPEPGVCSECRRDAAHVIYVRHVEGGPQVELCIDCLVQHRVPGLNVPVRKRTP